MEQKNPASPGGWDLLSSATYNAQHRVLTSTDAAGQATTYTYLPNGRLQTLVTVPRNGPSGPLTLAERTTTYSYYADNAPTGAGRLQTVTGPSTPQGSPVTSYTYDVYGRIRTATDPDNYALTYDYDALDRLTRATYPDGTYEEITYNRLDLEGVRDRLGRWRHTFHDALRRVVATRDALGRTTTLEWCTCGSLEKIIDANNNATTWERDVQGRVTRGAGRECGVGVHVREHDQPAEGAEGPQAPGDRLRVFWPPRSATCACSCSAEISAAAEYELCGA